MGLSKKKRFEVFKRDNFTCQYCGSKAPDVILECDHIKPKSKCGKDEITNLITSCKDCNRGKSNKELSDTSEIEKQRQQIEELNEKRKQIDMILEWKEGLKEQKDYELEKAIEYFNSFFSSAQLTSVGESKLKKNLRQFGLRKVLDGIEKAHGIYFDDRFEEEDIAGTIINKLGGILYMEDKPEHIKHISYIKGICKNRFNYFNSHKAQELLEQYYNLGGDLSILENCAKNEWKNWSDMKSELDYFIEESN